MNLFQLGVELIRCASGVAVNTVERMPGKSSAKVSSARWVPVPTGRRSP